MTKKELQKQINKLESKQGKRWRMLCKYLGIKEEEYAELEYRYYPYRLYPETVPVKKTRLIKK